LEWWAAWVGLVLPLEDQAGATVYIHLMLLFVLLLLDTVEVTVGDVVAAVVYCWMTVVDQRAH
jgi:hypothetical protein